MNSNTQSKDKKGSQSKHNHTYYNKRKNLYNSLSEKEIPTHDEVVFLNQYEDNQQKAKLQTQKHRNELKKKSQEGDAIAIGKVKAIKAKNNKYNKSKYDVRSKQIQMIKAKCPQTCTQEELNILQQHIEKNNRRNVQRKKYRLKKAQSIVNNHNSGHNENEITATSTMFDTARKHTLATNNDNKGEKNEALIYFIVQR